MIDPTTFLDPTAAAIVGGGTLAATVFRSSARDLARAVAELGQLFRSPFDGDAQCDQIAALSRIARRNGVMALDRARIADSDVAAAIGMIVDGKAPDEVAAMLQHLRRRRIDRHAAAADVWAGSAETAPAMGMVGTLVGLVALFARMQDTSAIGSAMAVALLATLYGALLANLVLSPVAARLRRRGRAEAMERLRLEAPLVALAVREQPRPVSFTPIAREVVA